MLESGPPQGANAPLAGQALARTDDAYSISVAGEPAPKDCFRKTDSTAIPLVTKELHAASNRRARKPVHGVLLLDKPLGLSSNQALQKAKWLLRAEKAGHTGTLDPLATGVLPLCFGAATKFSQLQLDADKTYEATLILGEKTTTADAEGDVIETRPVPLITQALLDELMHRFRGPLTQIPPMYSALKRDGKALYEYARKGEEVVREARNIVIYELNLALAQDIRARAAIKMIVKCSKGTYIRTLGEDIGEAIGCGAHLGSLRRIETGGFEAAQCVTLDRLEAMSDDERLANLLPPQILISSSPVVTLDADNSGRFLSGLRRRGAPGQWGPDATLVQVYGPAPDGGASSVFLGSAHVTADELIPERLLSPIEVGQLASSLRDANSSPA
jgi:tRNA pseudouridine55 synthase